MADEAIKLSSSYMDGSAIIDAAIKIWSRSNSSRIMDFYQKMQPLQEKLKAIN